MVIHFHCLVSCLTGRNELCRNFPNLFKWCDKYHSGRQVNSSEMFGDVLVKYLHKMTISLQYLQYPLLPGVQYPLLPGENGMDRNLLL